MENQQGNKKIKSIEEYEIEYADGEMYKGNKHFPNTIGFKIQWGAKNIGFGELTFYYDTATKEWSYDDEFMSANFCKAVLMKWLDSIYKERTTAG